VLELAEAQAAARKLGLEVTTSEIRRAEDITPAFDALKGRADALYVCADPLVNTHRIRVNTLALAASLRLIGNGLWNFCVVNFCTPMTVAGTSMLRASPPPQAWPLQPAKPPTRRRAGSG
jgi:hypothetical protein